MCVMSHMGPSHIDPTGLISPRTQIKHVSNDMKITGNHYKRRDPTKDPTKDRAKGMQKVNKCSKPIRCNLERSHNFSIISEPNVLIWLPYDDLMH
jgi:hypothetical protein